MILEQVAFLSFLLKHWCLDRDIRKSEITFVYKTYYHINILQAHGMLFLLHMVATIVPVTMFNISKENCMDETCQTALRHE